ncbi:L-rhamnose isomerase [Ligilactobacillus equi]|uniref:L-rhamnose isomerase n=1 Tax=Ligilactobacillus equi DSM 15833 = JCM 10991 TaxID=1423740 RepID=A0A0R1TCR2_9LACO|nr:L-rhamnose isomerase [Ligilactobacillus equi]KRL76261.1 L-rhamnose isomerase [Ligilactobacillus equi DSM 15833 = JCM 10991]
MVKEQSIQEAYEVAKQRYAEIGVDTEEAMKKLAEIKLSVHCWQGDDVRGFLNPTELGDGLSVTGNYPGRARTPEELTSDLHEALSLIPGKHKVALHSIYAVTDKKKDLDEVGPEDFKFWVDWAKKEGIGLDMNGTFFSHPMVRENLTLSSPDKDVRDFWIKVGIQSRRIANYFGQELGQQSVNNFWIPDGYKDNPVDKLAPRQRLIESLDEILAADEFDEKNTIESYEGKLFATGIESYTVGSHEFYDNYALTRNKLWTIDAGHFHPTEDVSDKFTSFLPFGKGLMLHVSRSVRWDSDHVVIMDDALARITRSLVRDNLLDKTNVGLDFFDATVNRVAAWVVGARATQKSFLQALLAPIQDLKDAENSYDYTTRLVETEELKSFPFGAVWDEFCRRNNVPVGTDWLTEVRQYEKNVQLKRD